MLKLGPFDVPGYHVGDARELARQLPDASIHAVVTSPPYWQQRDYGVEGQLGLEATPEEFITNLVALFREVRRALRDDGTLWLNLGDTYAGSGKGGGGSFMAMRERNGWNGKRAASGYTAPPVGLKPKDMVGIPWRTALALQADGWWLRSDVVWHKPNPMPEATTDRPMKAHEYLFLLSKSERYYYDGEAIMEPVAGTANPRGRGVNPKARGAGREQGRQNESFSSAVRGLVTKRNRRSVWTIAAEPSSDGHHAAFPRKLVEPCILAGCPTGGIVLDPFGGTGTVGRVAEDLGRKWLLLDINPAYKPIARRRTAQTGLLGRVRGAA